jgi:aspartyl-tRNA(Asn)/glutamyl-tRNA(Gln) amidotransferase subunit A
MTPTLCHSLAEIAAALRSRAVTCEELTLEAAARHAAFGPELDAYQVWAGDRALEQARALDLDFQRGAVPGPLAGLPTSIKDLFGVVGLPTYAGTARRFPALWEQEGPVVRELRRQEAVVVGKTRMVELAFGGLGTNPHWGTPVNPWDAEDARVPGGSSSGAGVSLQEGSAVLALGTDTACSVRTPAAWTGTVGLKTTRGRWSTVGMVPLSSTLDSVGLVTRTVADAAYAFAALDLTDAAFDLPRTPELSRVRFGLPDSSIWSQCTDEIGSVVRKALQELESKGARLIEVSCPEFDEAFDLYSTGHIATPECKAFVTEQLPEWLEILHESVGSRLRDTVELGGPEYQRALLRRRDLMTSAEQWWSNFDLLVTPTVPITAPRTAEVSRLEDYLRLNRWTSRGTNPVNILELCALSIPCGLDRNGIPVGLQLIAPGGKDRTLLASALAVERTLGTANERLGRPPRCS